MRFRWAKEMHVHVKQSWGPREEELEDNMELTNKRRKESGKKNVFAVLPAIIGEDNGVDILVQIGER